MMKLPQIYNFIVQNSSLAFGTTFCIQLIPFLLTGIMLLVGSDVFPADFTDIPMDLQHDPSYKMVTAWNQRDQDPYQPIFRPKFESDEAASSSARYITADIIELYYSTKDGSNILTASNLHTVRAFHQWIYQTLPYFSDFCVLANHDHHCAPIQSPAMFITIQNGSKYGENLPVQSQIQAVITNQTLKRQLQEFLPKNVDMDLTPVHSSGMRAYLSVSWAKYNASNRPSSTKVFAADYLGPFLWNISKNCIEIPNSDRNIRFKFYNQFLYYDRLQHEVKGDLMLAIGSFCFVFCFLWLQTGSLFVTVFGLFSIMSNFLTANLIYRYVFDFRYFGIFNVLSVFIILGIGVDDIFLFNDAWRCESSEKDISTRLIVSYRRSYLSMLTTSLTTTAAFLVNSLSPLLAISSFGLFSATLVVVNYFSVITFFPCVILYHHQFIQPKLQSVKQTMYSTVQFCMCKNVIKPARFVKEKTIGWLCRKYASMIGKPQMQALILISMASMFGFLVYSATQLESDNRTIRLYVHNHPFGEALKMRHEEYNEPLYNTQMENVRVFFSWGIRDLDKSHCHKTQWKNCRGDIMWDEYFDLNPYHAQRDLLKFCDSLKHMSDKEKADLMVKSDENGFAQVECFLQNMDDYFETEFNKIIFSSRRISGLPATDQKIEALMLNYPQLYDLASVLTNKFFYRNFETASLFWLYDGYRFLSQVEKHLPQDSVRRLSSNYSAAAEVIESFRNNLDVSNKGKSMAHARFGQFVGNSLNSSDVQRTLYKNMTLTYGTKLQYAAVFVNTSMTYAMGYKDGLSVLEKWQNFFDHKKLHMSPSLQGGVMITPDRNEVTKGLHHWMKVQKELSESAIRGVIISLAISLPVLIISTDDVIIGTLATAVICCAAASVIGTIPLLGWKLGVLESLNLTLVVGLAIDYIVHVAEAFHLSAAIGRAQKVADVLDKVGISIVSGAVSTLGSSMFMLFAQIAFFSQFGLFIFLTVCFSLVYSMGMLIVLLALIGPETQKYSVHKLANTFIAYFGSSEGENNNEKDRNDDPGVDTESKNSVQNLNECESLQGSILECECNEKEVEIKTGGRPMTAWKVKKRVGANPSVLLPPLSKL